MGWMWSSIYFFVVLLSYLYAVDSAQAEKVKCSNIYTHTLYTLYTSPVTLTLYPFSYTLYPVSLLQFARQELLGNVLESEGTEGLNLRLLAFFQHQL